MYMKETAGSLHVLGLKEEQQRKKMENLTDACGHSDSWIYVTLSILLARIELVELSEKAYILRHSEFRGFFPCM